MSKDIEIKTILAQEDKLINRLKVQKLTCVFMEFTVCSS